MKLNQIALAVAALAAAPAFAATGSLQALYGVTPANTVYVSGASALSGSFANVVGANCFNGSTNVKSLTIGGSTSDGRVTVCTTKSTDGQFSGPFAVVKRDTNGSFDGVGPVIDQSGLTKWADVNNCDSTTLNCALDSTTVRVPHAGLTDVDTNVWVGMANTGALSIPVTNPATTGTVLNGGFAGQGFGVMVSESLYNAMMAKQVAEGRLPVSAGSASCVAGNFTPGACQPSISKEEYAAIVDGGNFAYVANGALSGDTNVINLCRRVETSGTQASSNVYFLNNSCGNASPTGGFKPPKTVDLANSPTAVAFNTSSGNAVTGNYDDFGGAFGLFEGSGTGDARNCVIRRNSGKNPNNVADALGTYAAGWISLENAPAAGWKLVKLDGVSPNAVQVKATAATDTDGNVDGWMADTNQRTNVVKGYYDAAPELEMLWPSTTPYGTFLTSLKNTFANPALVSLRGVFQANGVFTHAGNETKVHKGTRNGNFCAPQALAE
ncbi:hypothetical protein [Sulfuriferula sp.]|uniref:hypothetical protein n=1 Tax=Sulfuriferula sp. TaxID=2025307 RepID=UPI00273064B1|nr:hypothetical protein [Sulfuriferula sp.]MDP2025343.1 hypothetical protein [Sulfuriferula sp.]